MLPKPPTTLPYSLSEEFFERRKKRQFFERRKKRQQKLVLCKIVDAVVFVKKSYFVRFTVCLVNAHFWQLKKDLSIKRIKSINPLCIVTMSIVYVN